jgi:phospholipid transport system substrate-binding protein
MIRKLLGQWPVILLLLFPLFTIAPSFFHGQEGPIPQVQATADQVIDLLQRQDIDLEERNRRIADLIKSKFDFRSMSQAVMGIHWRQATEAQRDRFIELFSQLLEVTYRGRLEAYTDEYAGEQVQYLRETIKNDRAQVDTLVVTKTARVPISYRLILRGSEWLVYDVVIEEVSLVRTYRGTYDDIMRRQGFDGLFERMESKIGEIRRTGDAGIEP